MLVSYQSCFTFKLEYLNYIPVTALISLYTLATGVFFDGWTPNTNLNGIYICNVRCMSRIWYETYHDHILQLQILMEIWRFKFKYVFNKIETRSIFRKTDNKKQNDFNSYLHFKNNIFLSFRKNTSHKNLFKTNQVCYWNWIAHTKNIQWEIHIILTAIKWIW